MSQGDGPSVSVPLFSFHIFPDQPGRGRLADPEQFCRFDAGAGFFVGPRDHCPLQFVNGCVQGQAVRIRQEPVLEALLCPGSFFP